MRSVQRFTAIASLAVLTACGGGLSIGIGIGDDDFSPPSVSLVADGTSVRAGQAMRFAAAAADESGIYEVAFYRLDFNTWVRLGSDGVAPYDWPVTAPADGRTSLSVFARATDNAGNQADSATVTVSVTP